MEKIPDEALVVRGGRNRPEDIQMGIGTHSSGITGISVQCEVGLSIEELVKFIPHGQIGVTTVGDVRNAGGDVIRTSGRGYHATLTGLTPEQISSGGDRQGEIKIGKGFEVIDPLKKSGAY